MERENYYAERGLRGIYARVTVFLSGLRAHNNRPLPGELFSHELTGMCVMQYQRVAPLQQWLVDLLGD
jgi:hypothetical protein